MTPAGWLDLFILIGLAIMVLAGWRAGVVATSAAFMGFVGGALLAGWVMAGVLSGADITPWVKAALTVAAMTILGIVGQVVLSGAAGRMRDSVTARPVRVMDSVAGVAVSGLAWLAAMWMLMSVLAYAPNSIASDVVHGSRTYGLLDVVLSEPGSQVLADVRSLLTSLDLPSLAFNPATVPPVDDPSGDPIPEAAVRVARESVVAIGATAPACGTSVVGSGVVVAPERVVTNAHVVASAERVSIRLSSPGAPLAGTVIHFNPADDLAVLYVPGLRAPAPEWVVDVSRGVSSVVAGFPGGGPLRLEPARVRGASHVPAAQGPGSREVEVFRGLVRGGNSGGALLDPNGRIIGIVFAALEGDDSTGFALAADQVIPQVRASMTTTAPATTQGCPASFGRD